MPEKAGSGLPPSGFGAMLRSVREEKGLTQKELGEKANVHPNTIARMERGEVEPSWQMVLALAKSLDVDCTAFNTASPGAEKPPESDDTEPEKPVKKSSGKKK